MPHKGRLFMHRGDYRGRLQLKKTQVLARQLYRSTKKNTGLWPGQTGDSSRDQHNLNVFVFKSDLTMEHQKRNLHSRVQGREINPSFTLSYLDYFIGFLTWVKNQQKQRSRANLPNQQLGRNYPRNCSWDTRRHTKREEPELESHRNSLLTWWGSWTTPVVPAVQIKMIKSSSHPKTHQVQHTYTDQLNRMSFIAVENIWKICIGMAIVI